MKSTLTDVLRPRFDEFQRKYVTTPVGVVLLHFERRLGLQRALDLCPYRPPEENGETWRVLCQPDLATYGSRDICRSCFFSASNGESLRLFRDLAGQAGQFLTECSAAASLPRDTLSEKNLVRRWIFTLFDVAWQYFPDLATRRFWVEQTTEASLAPEKAVGFYAVITDSLLMSVHAIDGLAKPLGRAHLEKSPRKQKHKLPENAHNKRGRPRVYNAQIDQALDWRRSQRSTGSTWQQYVGKKSGSESTLRSRVKKGEEYLQLAEEQVRSGMSISSFLNQKRLALEKYLEAIAYAAEKLEERE